MISKMTFIGGEKLELSEININMKRAGCRKQTILFLVVIFPLLFTSCGSSYASPTPIEVLPGQTVGNTIANTFINIFIKSIDFTGAVSNNGSEGNLQLFMVVSDDFGACRCLDLSL